MNRDNINKNIAEIEAIDVWNIFKETYPNTDLSTITIQEWSLANLEANLNRLILQFKNKMNDEEFEYLPNNFLMHEIDPNVNYVTIYLSSIAENFAHKNLDEVVRSIKWLISYQVAYGFWNKSETKIHDPKTIDLKNKASEIEVLKSKVEDEITKVKELENTLSTSIKELNTFYSQKQEELQGITNSHQDVLNKNNEVANILIQINDLKSQATAALGSIEETKNSSKKVATEGETFIKTISQKLETLSNDLETHIKGQENRIKSIDDNYLHIQSKKDFIDLKELDIIKLATKAGDGALGHTFNTRETKLGKNARLWMLGTGGMAFVLFIWIFVVLAYLGTNYSPVWVNPLFSTLKTLPALLILVFVAKQYTKERNLEEEYAFKSAISMTLTAYADEIAREKDVDRRAIIKDTIEKVYKSPKITAESVGLFSIREKHLETLAEKTADNLGRIVGNK